MAPASPRWTTRFARASMLAAMLAFMVQGILVWNSQVAAATGLMPQPAVMIGGDAHYHDPLGGNVHHHPNGDVEGHVHTQPAGQDDEPQDRSGCISVCSLFAASISFPASAFVAVPLRVGASLEMTRADFRTGIDPAALIRPPRPLRIA